MKYLRLLELLLVTDDDQIIECACLHICLTRNFSISCDLFKKMNLIRSGD